MNRPLRSHAAGVTLMRTLATPSMDTTLNRARAESEDAAHLCQLADDDMRKRHRRQWLILAVVCGAGLLLAGIQLAAEQGWL